MYPTVDGNSIEKCLISEHFIIPSWEEKSSIFSLNMYPIFLDNQVYFILNTIIWSKFCRKMFLYLCKYSYKANMWIFTWNSKHTNIFCKEKGKKWEMKQSMSPSCPFSWFSFKFFKKNLVYDWNYVFNSTLWWFET